MNAPAANVELYGCPIDLSPDPVPITDDEMMFEGDVDGIMTTATGAAFVDIRAAVGSAVQLYLGSIHEY